MIDINGGRSQSVIPARSQRQTPGAHLFGECMGTSLVGVTCRNVQNCTLILDQWTELMRLKASIETGAVVPSVILRKLAAAGAGNVLSRALRALGRIERTLFTLQWLSDPVLRQRSHAGLNKGEASNALRRAVFFHLQGEFETVPSRTKVSAHWV